jgi:hypothetical protein
MQSLTEYMKKELVFYIKQEYDKGVPLTTIRKALLEGGHHTNLVKEAFSSLKKHKYNLVKALNEPVKSNLDKELYFNIMNSLVKYIEYQLEAGKDIDEIKKILEHYGHSKDLIEKAISSVNNQLPKAKNIARYIDGFFILGVLVSLFFLAGATQEPLELIALGLFPTILTLVGANIVAYNKGYEKYLWSIPIGSIILFVAVGFLDISKGLDMFKLGVLNLILSIGYTYVKAIRIIGHKSAIDILKLEVATESDAEADSKKKESKKGKKKE